MFVSVNNKFIYYHYPKTGGSTIQHALLSYGYSTLGGEQKVDVINFWRKFNGGPPPKHYSVNSDVDRKLIKVYPDLFRFGSVRNPWDLVISTFKFRGETPNKNKIMGYSDYPTFLECGQMSNFYDINNTNIEIIKLEDIDDDFSKVCKYLNIDDVILPKKTLIGLMMIIDNIMIKSLKNMLVSYLKMT